MIKSNNQPLTNLITDLNNLKLYCCNNKNGCTKILSYEDFKIHIKSQCEFGQDFFSFLPAFKYLNNLYILVKMRIWTYN